MRSAAVFVLVLAAFVQSPRSTTDQLVAAWYPILQVGNTWVYADESRDADGHHGIDDPTVGRWTATETVTAARTAADGIHVTIRTTISDLVRVHSWLGDPSRMLPLQHELLVRGSCVYQPGPPYWLVWSSGDQPLFCFPMSAGGEWGRTPDTPPDGEDVWRVRALNGDPFGAPGARTFHVYGFQGSGDTTDYWFQQGVGVVQFVEEHHGTYSEDRRRLVSATIGGVRRHYTLKPARTVPLYGGECRDGWRHFVRADGSLIPDYATCVKYAPPDPFG